MTILAILPMSSAYTERSFSTMKCLKNNHRSTMDQERMISLALINIHHDYDINTTEIVAMFMNDPKRRKWD